MSNETIMKTETSVATREQIQEKVNLTVDELIKMLQENKGTIKAFVVSWFRVVDGEEKVTSMVAGENMDVTDLIGELMIQKLKHNKAVQAAIKTQAKPNTPTNLH